MNVDLVKEKMFDLNDPTDKAFSYFEVINTFASDLAEKQQDLDPRISKLVDDHFWKLLAEPADGS